MKKAIKNLIVSIVAEIILLAYAYNLYKFIVFTDGLNSGVLFVNTLLLVALSVMAVINFINILDIDLDY